ncbi:hypothetical protein DFH27DRAFT_607017 [Peziza echinospora]|nr:hypothetical protein DFH27DRAFT_607017 [Peziza echinospora]
MLVGISILVACATFLCYLHLPAGSTHDQSEPSTSSHHTPPTSIPTQQSNSFAGLMWAFLCASLGVSSSGRNRGGGGGAGSRGLGGRTPAVSPASIQLPLLRQGLPFPVSAASSSLSTPSAPAISQVPQMILSSPVESPDTTPKARPTVPNGNSYIPSISLSSPNGIDEDDFDDDAPPSFPAINSAQRARSGNHKPSTTPLVRPGNTLSSTQTLRNPMAPPPLLPQIRGRNPRSPPTTLAAQVSSRASPAALARGVVPQRNMPGTAGGNGISLNGGIPSLMGSSSSLALPPTHTAPPVKPSRKVILEPGHSPLDWARLCRTSPPEELRGPNLPPTLLRVTPSMLAKYGRPARKSKRSVEVADPKAPKEMVWMALEGKVYNITAYIPFHPGGEGELLRCAGKDGTDLFMKTHSWVNVDGMLGGCLVGILVSEEEGDEATVDTPVINGRMNDINGNNAPGVMVGPGLEDVD